MTTIIDHAINIPSPTQIVWALVSNPELFPRWQADCQRVAFLTTQRRGKNTRLRCIGDSGKEYVMEISAWYEGLGYEYKIVDGGPYETNQGRVRLQEIAEGTVVQWTFSYSLAGVLGSLRNMGVRRSAENQVIDSLRNLYRFVRDSAGENNIKLIKSMMQDAPDVDQRATYQPRHPSQYDEEKIRQTGTPARPVPVQRTPLRPIIDEPLPAEDDTQRNQSASAAPAASAAPIEVPLVRPPTQAKPSTNPNAPFVRPINAPEPPAARPAATQTDSVPSVRSPFEPRRDYSTTIPAVPNAPRETRETPAAPPTESRPAASLSEARPFSPGLETPRPVERPPLSTSDLPRVSMPTPPAAAGNLDPLTTPPPLDIRPPTPATRPPAAPTIPARPSTTGLPPVTDKPLTTDTGKMSVFELFGLPKPSETQQMKAVNLPLPLRPETAPTPPSSPAPTPVTNSAPQIPEPEITLGDTGARAAFQEGMPQSGDLTPEPVRQGWRAVHRRQMLSLRRPTKPQ